MANTITEGQVLMVNLSTNNAYPISEAYAEMSIRYKFGRKATAKEISKYLGTNEEQVKSTNKTIENGKSIDTTGASEGIAGAIRNRPDSGGKAS